MTDQKKYEDFKKILEDSQNKHIKTVKKIIIEAYYDTLKQVPKLEAINVCNLNREYDDEGGDTRYAEIVFKKSPELDSFVSENYNTKDFSYGQDDWYYDYPKIDIDKRTGEVVIRYTENDENTNGLPLTSEEFEIVNNYVEFVWSNQDKVISFIDSGCDLDLYKLNKE